MISRRVVLGAGLAAPALLKGPASAQADGRPVLRIAVQALPPTLEPLETISNVGLRVTYNVFDSLFRRDFLAEAEKGGQHIVPHLATALTRRDDLTWQIDLRKDVRFHDGSPMTATDLLATFSAERMYGPKPYAFEGAVNFGHLAGAEAEGDHRIILRTKTPDIVMAHRLAAYGGWVISAKQYATGGVDALRQKPLGTGPYRIASFQRDARVVLDSFDEYFMGRPPAKQVVITVVPEASSRLAGLRSGDFDLVTNLLPEHVEELKGHPTLEGADVPLDLLHYLYFDTRNPVVKDARVRRALNHAIDFDTLGSSLWGPGFKRMAALQTPGFGDFYEADRKGLAYDPARAKALLAEAGYRGEEIVIRNATGYYLQMHLALQAIQSMWQAVGVNSRLESVENAAMLVRPGADVRPISMSFRFPDPLSGGLLVHLSKDYSTQKAGFWQPARFNALSDEMRLATDPADRKRLWRMILDEYEAEAPGIILYPVREYFAKKRSMRWTHYPLYYFDFRSYNLSFAGS
jgi:peptide/nickel transport system substrate-binding protein